MSKTQSWCKTCGQNERAQELLADLEHKLKLAQKIATENQDRYAEALGQMEILMEEVKELRGEK